jgi:hypothetical protein
MRPLEISPAMFHAFCLTATGANEDVGKSEFGKASANGTIVVGLIGDNNSQAVRWVEDTSSSGAP